MILELAILLVVTLLYVLVARVKRFIPSNFSLEDSRVRTLRSEKFKSLDEQKEFVTLKDDMGSDFITVVYSWVLFIVPFIFVFYPRVDNFIVGLVVSLVVSLVLAFVGAKFIFPKFFDLMFIRLFLQYLYVSFFMFYTKFIYLPNFWLVIVFIVVILFGSEWLLNKMGL